MPNEISINPDHNAEIYAQRLHDLISKDEDASGAALDHLVHDKSLNSGITLLKAYSSGFGDRNFDKMVRSELLGNPCCSDDCPQGALDFNPRPCSEGCVPPARDYTKPEYASALVEALATEENEEVREMIIKMLQFHETSPTVVQALIQALQTDTSREVRETSVRSLWAHQTDEVCQALVEAYDKTDISFISHSTIAGVLRDFKQPEAKRVVETDRRRFEEMMTVRRLTKEAL